MATDDQVHQLVEGVLRDVRAKVEAEVSSLVSRMRQHADAQQQTAVESARAAAEAKAREVLAGAESKAREAIAAAETKARAAIANAHEDAARRSEESARKSEEAVAKTREDARRLIDAARAEADHLVQAAVADAQSKERQAELAGAERLIEAVRAFDHARSLTEVLHLLADKTAEIAPRVAVLTVEGRSLRSWRLIGFPGAFSDLGFETDIDDADVLGVAISTGQSCTTSSSNRVGTPTFAQLRDGRVGLAVPLEVGGQIVAVLYADDDTPGDDLKADDGDRIVPSAWPEVAELLARHAARCLQALTGSRIVDALAGSDV